MTKRGSLDGSGDWLERFRRELAAIQKEMKPLFEAADIARRSLGGFDSGDVTRILRDLGYNPDSMKEALQLATPDLKALNEAARRARQFDDEMRMLEQSLRFGVAETPLVSALEPFRVPALELDLVARAVADGQATAKSFRQLLRVPELAYALASVGALSRAIDSGPFTEQTVAALQSQLGDWTRVSDLPALLASDRVELYERLGLEPRLRIGGDPLEAVIGATGLRSQQAPPLLPGYGPADFGPPPLGLDETSQAAEDYKYLFRLETQLRDFIDRTLTETHGRRWIRTHVHGDIRKAWKARQEEARTAKAPSEVHESLLAYSDLGQLGDIICQNNNWPLFQPFFGRRESVRESFARLAPLRNDIGHCRALVPGDRLYLYVEVRRLTQAMQVEAK